MNCVGYGHSKQLIVCGTPKSEHKKTTAPNHLTWTWSNRLQITTHYTPLPTGLLHKLTVDFFTVQKWMTPSGFRASEIPKDRAKKRPPYPNDRNRDGEAKRRQLNLNRISVMVRDYGQASWEINGNDSKSHSQSILRLSKWSDLLEFAPFIK